MDKKRKRQIPVLIIALLLTTLFFFIYESCSENLPKTESPEELIKKKLPPDKILIKAIEQVEKGEKAIQESYVQALKHYQNALELVEAILNHYPSSELALNISLGNQKIGNYTYAQLKDKVNKIKEWAQVESDPVSFILLIATKIANKIENASPKAYTLRDIAKAYAQAGNKEMADKIFLQALNSASQIEDAEDKAYALRSIASASAQAGLFNQALEIVKQTNNDKVKIYVLSGIGISLAQSKAILDPETQKLLHQLYLSLL